MSEQRPQGPSRPDADPKVIVLNSDVYLRTIDFGEVEGARKCVTIPSARMDGFKRLTPGRCEMSKSDWDAICAHPTAKHLVNKGTLSLFCGKT